MHPLLDRYFKLVKRFIPQKAEINAIGLDIGAGECKLVELSRTDQGFELLHWAVEPIQSGNVQGTVQKMLDQIETPCKSVYTSVFGKGTLIRYIDMPKMSIDNLKQAFAIEADKYFPFSQDQIYTDCYILDPNVKGTQMSVLAAAAKKELVDQRITLLESLGLEVNCVGVNPIALANVLNTLGLNYAQKDTAVALLDMGDSVSNLTILFNNNPRFTRDIFIGGRELTKKISNALAISFQDAEKLKIQPGDRSAEVLNIAESVVMNIVQELKLSFDYFATEKNIDVSTLLLTGGGCMLAGVEESFRKNLDINVKQWNPLESLKISSKVSADELKKMSLKLGVALGLALYQYD